VEIRTATIAELLATAGTLFREHWEEIARNKGLMVLNPDAERYAALEAAGNLLCLSAWDGPELVGYSVTFISQHLHYAGLRYAQNDILFVTKAARHGKVGLQLIRETERAAKENGAKLLTWHAKQGTALEALLPRLKYGVHEVIYSKEL